VEPRRELLVWLPRPENRCDMLWNGLARLVRRNDGELPGDPVASDPMHKGYVLEIDPIRWPSRGF
jgi:hypothetical protein